MSKLFSIFLMALVFYPIHSFSQTGPGGVGSNDGTSDLVMWFRTDNGLETTGSSVTTWSNSAGYSEHDMTVESGVAPIVVPSNINDYDEVRFNDQGFLYTGLSLTTANFVTNEATSITVTQLITKKKSKIYGNFPLASSNFLAYLPWPNNRVYFYKGEGDLDDFRIDAHQPSTSYFNYSIWTYGANVASGKQIYRDGGLLKSTNGSVPFTDHSTCGFQIGQDYKGNIPEIVIYKTKVNTARRIIIDNYLSAKYGLSLSSNDLYTQDNPGNGDFDHNVAGIGKESWPDQHFDSQGTGIVRISRAGLSNNKYLFWGENKKDATYSFAPKEGDNYKEYIDTEWRVSEPSNIDNNLVFKIEKSDLNFDSQFGCHNLELLVDNDADFSSPTVYSFTENSSSYILENLGFDDGDYFTLSYVDKIVWDGVSSYFNGSGSSNSPSMSDSCLKLLVKQGTKAVLTANAHVREVEVEAGATLEIADGVDVTIENGINNNGNINLLGEAQLIQKHTGVSLNSGSGELSINQQGSLNLYNYNYWSAPVNRSGSWKIKYLEETDGVVSFAAQNDANPTTTPLTLSNVWLYGFNAVEGDYYGWSYLGTESEIAPGIGYTMKGSGSMPELPMTFTEENYVFKGEANSGDYSYPVAAGNDFLIGNPYPSALDANQFINDNLSVIDGTLYFWEQFEANDTHITENYQGGYATLNLMMGVSAVAFPGLNGGTASKGAPKNGIPVGQGFFVNVDAGGTLVFKNSQRIFAKESLSEATFFKASSESTVEADDRIKYWLTFSDAASRVREIGLGYDSNASVGYDKGYDSKNYDAFPDNMLWSIPDHKLSIQGLNSFNVDSEIPLFLKITTPGVFNIGLKETLNFPDDVAIYLKDNLNNAFYNLMEGDVSLTFEAGEDETRYSIVYQEENLSVADNDLGSDVDVIYDSESQQIVLKGFKQLKRISKFNVYNILGQHILSLESLDSNKVSLPNVSSGVYVVEIVEDGEAKLSKKFIKY